MIAIAKGSAFGVHIGRRNLLWPDYLWKGRDTDRADPQRFAHDVIETGRARDVVRPPDPTAVRSADVGGWGFRVIDVLSEDWAASRKVDGTQVWMGRRYRGRPHGIRPGSG